MRMRICSLASSGSGAFLGAGVFWEVTVIKFTGFAGTSRVGVPHPLPWSPYPDIRTSGAIWSHYLDKNSEGVGHRLGLWRRGQLRRTTTAAGLRCTPFGPPHSPPQTAAAPPPTAPPPTAPRRRVTR